MTAERAILWTLAGFVVTLAALGFAAIVTGGRT